MYRGLVVSGVCRLCAPRHLVQAAGLCVSGADLLRPNRLQGDTAAGGQLEDGVEGFPGLHDGKVSERNSGACMAKSGRVFCVMVACQTPQPGLWDD